MPTNGETQTPAGVKLPCGCKPLGTREMRSRQGNIDSTLRIDNIPYKGNAVLRANS